VLLFVQSLLGLHPVAPLALLVVDPHLPEWLPSLTLRGVRVGEAVVDLEAERAGARTHLRVLRRQGRVRIVRQAPPEAAGASIWSRAVGLVRSSR
jgi:hypothetical protein